MLEIWPKSPWLPLLRLALVYLGLLVLMASIQRRLIYMPSRYDLAEAHRRAQASGMTLWPAGEGEGYVAFLAEPRQRPVKGTILVFHGNAGDAAARVYYAEALGQRGYRVLLAEYPGYGARAGALAESALVADGAKIWRRARAAYEGPVLLLGESLGAGVAAGVAAAVETAPDALILVTPWDSLVALAQRRYWFLPVRWLLRDRYDNVAYLRAFRGPVAVVTAEDDRIVPAWHSDRLIATLGVRQRHWVLPACGHNDWPADAGETWWDEVLAFSKP